MLKIRKIAFLLFVFCIPFIGSAQQEKMAAALNFLQKGNLDSAKISIDQAVVNSATASSYEAWHIRGFVYKEIYKAKEKSNKKSPARVTAIESLKRSLVLDSTKAVYQDNVQGIKFLATTLYNDAATSMDTLNYEVAVINFEKFKLYYSIVDTSADNLKQKEIEFQLAMATIYTQIYRSRAAKDVKFFNMAKTALNTVLSIDPNNVTANYNMGLLYYNQAVDLINETDYGIDFVTLNEIQDNSIILFKQSLPFMEKAYKLNPKKRETLIGLSGIYFGLNEKEKSDEFKQKSEELEKEK